MELTEDERSLGLCAETKILDSEQCLIRMYTELHGAVDPRSSFALELVYDEYDTTHAIGLYLMKDGSLCAYHSKTDLLFDYITNGWTE